MEEIREGGQDLLDDFGLFDERDDPHGSRTPGTRERIHPVGLRDQPCPRAHRGRGGDPGERGSTRMESACNQVMS